MCPLQWAPPARNCCAVAGAVSAVAFHPPGPDGDSPFTTAWSPEDANLTELLRSAPITKCDLLPWGSNYTFLAQMDGGPAGLGLGVYKPRRGEAPLYDFPDGTLYRREYAAYVVSSALGWGFIPPTVIREEGPYGVGSMQLFIPNDMEANYFTFRAERMDELRLFAAFDAATNNADRKGGHCLLGFDGKLWGIDHGLTFNAYWKLRTVIWDFQGEPMPQPVISDLASLQQSLATGSQLALELGELIDSQEMDALRRRLEQLTGAGRFPEPHSRRSMPWPPV